MKQDEPRATHTMLVIDDSEVVLEMTRFTLERAGYRVITRDRAQGSIAATLNEQPDTGARMPKAQRGRVAAL
jgi:CheY-like chemotaxis protein